MADNLYASCVEKSADSVKLSRDEKTEMLAKVDEILSQCVTHYLSVSAPLLSKCEAPFLPLSFTLWR